MHARPVLEPLEKRQLLSAAGCDTAVERLDAVGATRPATVAGPAAAASVTSAPAPRPALASGAAAAINPFAEELLGTFRGELKVKKFFIRKSFDVELIVTEVTDTGITGKLTVDGHDVEGTFPGVLKPNGRFNYTFREDGRRVSLRGKIVPQNDRLVGKGKFNAFGLSASGSFKLDRVPAPAAPPG